MKRGKIAERGESAANERIPAACRWSAQCVDQPEAKARASKSAALRPGKPDHYDAAAVKEIMARNPWMNVAEGLTFKESERVNYDPATGLVVKAGTPDTVPLGEVVLFVPPTDGRGAFAAIFTDEKFYREYTLTGKDKPPC